MNIFYTLVDEDGRFYPLAGIFQHNEYGKDEAEKIASKNDDLSVVVVEIKLI